MATLVLTALGTALGGPIGGAIGAALGQAADRSLFSGRREGPRLTDLKVQTSSYGTPIPRLFGRMRVAGTVIWASDLIETRNTTGGGKSGPRVTQYSYSASFAVLLSARRIADIGRIWADGELIRGVAGDWKVRTGFRLYQGGADQMPDPLIASAEGAGQAPAWRGHAYAMFEQLDLSEFGNRIPSLTFEVIADAEPVGVGDVLRTLSAVLDAEAPGTTLIGLAVESSNVREAASEIAAMNGGWWRQRNGALILCNGPTGGPVRTIADQGWHAESASDTPSRRSIAPLNRMPGAVSIAHYDPARDYQTGVQRASRPNGGTEETRLAIPAAIPADQALSLAEQALDRAFAARERRWIGLSSDALSVTPGERAEIAGEHGLWRIAEVTTERNGHQVQLVRIAAAGAVGQGLADPGRVYPSDDRVHGPSIVAAFELPMNEGAPAISPRLAIAVTGAEAGWRSAALLTAPQGSAWQAIGGTQVAAVMGSVIAPPGDGSALLIDRQGTVTVRLSGPRAQLIEADAGAVDQGANLALIGDELIQFMHAEPLGADEWRLSGLWRGRRGTEWAIADHGAGERFVLIEGDALTVVDLNAGAIGGVYVAAAQGVGDAALVEASARIDGRSVRPPSPVRLIAGQAADSLTLGWTRRSRQGWNWIGAIDAPLGEAAERYQVTVTDGAAVVSTDEATAPTLTLGMAGRPRPWRIAVRQIGDLAASQPLVATID